MEGIAPVNGTELYFESAGSGEPVVLIHAYPLDARMWDEQFAAFTTSRRVIRYDVRGFGRSASPSATPFSHADDLRALLEYLGASPAHVVGLSMGGRIGLHYALEYPAAISSLTVAGSALDGHDYSRHWEDAFEAIVETAKQSGVPAANDAWFAHELFAPARENAAVAAALRRILDDHAGYNWLNESPVLGLDPPAADRLIEIRCPTLVIVGERDLPDFQTIANTLSREIAGAHRADMRGAGHMCNMEYPAEFNAIVLDFLDAVNAAGSVI
jgi:3-oxoadipate enol-lactonase